mmetsp:Transcript_14132/g.19798  ORF Transcript_14132/g.19798 Transcript_14132/m.19798 type:complete len:128 (-) Transcript_14132:130-513(-)
MARILLSRTSIFTSFFSIVTTVQGQVPGQPWNVCYLEYEDLARTTKSSNVDVQEFCRSAPECEENIMKLWNPELLECAQRCHHDSDCIEGMLCFEGLTCNNPIMLVDEEEAFLRNRLSDTAEDKPWD